MTELAYGHELETYRSMVGSVNELNELYQAAPASHRPHWDMARIAAYADLGEFTKGAEPLKTFFSTICEIEELGGVEALDTMRKSLNAMKEYSPDQEWVREEEARILSLESVLPVLGSNDSRVVKEAIAYKALFGDDHDPETSTDTSQSFETVSLGGALLVNDVGITGLDDGRLMPWERIVDLSHTGKSAWTADEVRLRCRPVISAMLKLYDEVPTREMVPLKTIVRRVISYGVAADFVEGWDPDAENYSVQKGQLSAKIETAIAKMNRLMESEGYPGLFDFARDKSWVRGANNTRYYRFNEEYLGRVEDTSQ